MSRKLVWRSSPERLFQVFNRRRRSCGVWNDEFVAKAELAKCQGSYLLVLDEYRAKLPHLGHCYRVVVAQVTP